MVVRKVFLEWFVVFVLSLVFWSCFVYFVILLINLFRDIVNFFILLFVFIGSWSLKLVFFVICLVILVIIFKGVVIEFVV